MSNCRYCNQPVTWAITISGRKVPLDPEPGWRGRYILEQGQTGKLFARIVGGRPTEPNRYAYHACQRRERPRSEA